MLLILFLKSEYIVGYFIEFFCHKLRLNISQKSDFFIKNSEK